MTMLAILGKKIGMTQVFDESGTFVCVTAVEAGPCPVLAIKGNNVQLGFDPAKESRVKKPVLGYFKKLNIAPCKVIREVDRDVAVECKVGDLVKADIFKPGDFVDVTGTSLGKGFQGGMKRWNWSGTPMTHGSTSHRRVGSIGASTTPGRVFRGTHMPGHMGAERVTTQNLKVIKVDLENNILFIEGSVPGYKSGYVVVRRAKKKVAKVLSASAQAAAAKKKKKA